MDIPDHIYNWLVESFTATRIAPSTVVKRLHCVTSASIIQGSAIGLASYVVTAADLCFVTPGNSLCKYSDDTYIISPVVNVHSRVVEAWARLNNLHLNLEKYASCPDWDIQGCAIGPASSSP